MQAVGMAKTDLCGFLYPIQLKGTNPISESVNASIQKIKAKACGARKRARLRVLILFQWAAFFFLPARISEGQLTQNPAAFN